MWKSVCLILYLQASWTVAQQPVEKVCDLFLQGISVDKGQEVNWEVLQSLFTSNAQFTLTMGEKVKTLSFEDFKSGTQYTKNGFREKAVSRKTTVFGNIAQVAEIFEASIPGSEVRYEGVNMYLMVKDGADWKIAALTYEVSRPGLPTPTDW